MRIYGVEIPFWGLEKDQRLVEILDPEGVTYQSFNQMEKKEVSTAAILLHTPCRYLRAKQASLGQVDQDIIRSALEVSNLESRSQPKFR